jgi:hypothetical protein
MKTTFAVFIALSSFSFPVFAATPCEFSSTQLATVLINSAEKLSEIRKAGISEARAEPTCRKVEDGVREYRFRFSSCGSCLPKTAELSVTQDLRPSYTDGPVKYDFSVTYSK